MAQREARLVRLMVFVPSNSHVDSLPCGERTSHAPPLISVAIPEPTIPVRGKQVLSTALVSGYDEVTRLLI